MNFSKLKMILQALPCLNNGPMFPITHTRGFIVEMLKTWNLGIRSLQHKNLFLYSSSSLSIEYIPRRVLSADAHEFFQKKNSTFQSIQEHLGPGFTNRNSLYYIGYAEEHLQKTHVPTWNNRTHQISQHLFLHVLSRVRILWKSISKYLSSILWSYIVGLGRWLINSRFTWWNRHLTSFTVIFG